MPRSLRSDNAASPSTAGRDAITLGCRCRTCTLAPEQLEPLLHLIDDVAEDEFERLQAMADCAARRRDDGLSEILSWTNLGGLTPFAGVGAVAGTLRLQAGLLSDLTPTSRQVAEWGKI